MMIEIQTDYFDPAAIVRSGQMFRFSEENGVYTLFSKNDAAKIVKVHGKYVIISSNDTYFRNYFDLETDYGRIESSLNQPELAEALVFGRGMRILRQDPFETLVCFLISQNNHIPRIRQIVTRLCERLGERRRFDPEASCGSADDPFDSVDSFPLEYFTFPSAQRMAEAGEAFYREIGAGYRAPYLQRSAERAAGTDFEALKIFTDRELGEEILRFPGVGPKVRDCIVLFGFGRQNAFPVDTWIEKVYHERFGGKETDRRRMTSFFENRFGEYSGFVQQMLFYHARCGASTKPRTGIQK